jgi:hypothetical protein
MLVTLHWVENRKRYLLGLLAIAGLLIAWFSFLLAVDKFSAMDTFYQFSAFFAGLFVIGCLLAGTSFSQLGDRRQGIGYLSIPASHLEKLLCVLFFNVFLYFVAFLLVFYIVDIPFVKAANKLLLARTTFWPGTTHRISASPVYNFFTGFGAPIPEQDGHAFLVGYFAIQSTFILGSVYFTRSSFLKTTVAVLLLMLVFVLFITEGVEKHLPDGWRINDLFQWTRASTLVGQRQWVRLPGWIDSLLWLLLRYCLPPLFWVITYFRLREKEV